MMRSLSSAVGGLRAHQTKMDVIGNNIANVNTAGFKASRVTFSDVYYQTLSGASRPGTVKGGTNPTQIGYGASVATIDVLNTQTSGNTTDRAMDVYITGDGFLTTQDADGNLKYTRLGILGFDPEGNLVDANGNFVMGIKLDANGKPIINPDGTVSPHNLERIKVDPDLFADIKGISISPNGEIVGILPGDTQISQNGGLPAWIKPNGISISPASSLTGDVTLVMEERSSLSTSSSLPTWIQDLDFVSNSGIQGTLNFSYDGTNLSAIGPNGERYEGRYVQGGSFDMKDVSGNIVMTVTSDQYVLPVAGGAGAFPLNVDKKLMLSVSAVDKGGNLVQDEIEYTGQTTVTLGGVTVELDPMQVEISQEKSVQMLGTLPAWLTAAQIATDSGMPDGNLILQAGREYTPSFTPGSLFSLFDSNDVKAVFKEIAETTGYAGDYKLQWVDDTFGNYALTIQDNGGNTLAEATFVQTASGAGAISGITYSAYASTMTGSTAVSGAPVGLSIGLSSALTTDQPTAQLAGGVSVKNMIYAFSGTTLLGSVQYNSGATRVTINGDLQLQIDPATMSTFFTTPANIIVTPLAASGTPVGTISSNPEEQWAFNGKVARASTADGEPFIIGNIALAKIPNAAGMSQEGLSTFMTTSNSGEATYVKPGIAGTGTLKAGYLEMSNVDISKEFTDMITTQRGFQANTRIITVSDEMLQELVNLKR